MKSTMQSRTGTLLSPNGFGGGADREVPAARRAVGIGHDEHMLVRVDRAAVGVNAGCGCGPGVSKHRSPLGIGARRQADVDLVGQAVEPVEIVSGES
jgi:hypothetical protein